MVDMSIGSTKDRETFESLVISEQGEWGMRQVDMEVLNAVNHCQTFEFSG